MVLKDWQPVLAKVQQAARRRGGRAVRAHEGAGRARGTSTATGAFVMGIVPEGAGRAAGDDHSLATATAGDFRFATRRWQAARRGGRLAAGEPAERLSRAQTRSRSPRCGTAVNPVTGMPVPRVVHARGHGVFETGMYEYDNAYVYVSLPVAQELAGLGSDVTGLEVRTTNRWTRARRSRARSRSMLGYPYRTDGLAGAEPARSSRRSSSRSWG